MDWEVLDSNHPHPDADADLLLFHVEGGQKCVGILTKCQSEELSNAWDFERRGRKGLTRPPSFSAGELDDWTGIGPDSDWHDLIHGYHLAIETLSVELSPAAASPYLFLCRHVVELQLKAIIMLGQEVLELTSDLPSHHDLQRLWTSAYPMAKNFVSNRDPSIDTARQLVDDYHAADPHSVNFRYPVTKSNQPVAQAEFIHEFSLKQHATAFKKSCEALNDVIRRLRFSIAFKSLNGK